MVWIYKIKSQTPYFISLPIQMCTFTRLIYVRVLPGSASFKCFIGQKRQVLTKVSADKLKKQKTFCFTDKCCKKLWWKALMNCQNEISDETLVKIIYQSVHSAVWYCRTQGALANQVFPLLQSKKESMSVAYYFQVFLNFIDKSLFMMFQLF